VILEQRQRELDPNIYDSFEQLYYAINKYQQRGPPTKEDSVKAHKFTD
jgi:hypothetical protein